MNQFRSLVASLCLGLAACGGGDNTNTKDQLSIKVIGEGGVENPLYQGAGTNYNVRCGYKGTNPEIDPCESGHVTGSIVTLRAVPGAYSEFVSWEGRCEGHTEPECSFELDGNVSVTARFTDTKNGTDRLPGLPWKYSLNKGMQGSVSVQWYGAGGVNQTESEYQYDLYVSDRESDLWDNANLYTSVNATDIMVKSSSNEDRCHSAIDNGGYSHQYHFDPQLGTCKKNDSEADSDLWSSFASRNYCISVCGTAGTLKGPLPDKRSCKESNAAGTCTQRGAFTYGGKGEVARRIDVDNLTQGRYYHFGLAITDADGKRNTIHLGQSQAGEVAHRTDIELKTPLDVTLNLVSITGEYLAAKLTYQASSVGYSQLNVGDYVIVDDPDYVDPNYITYVKITRKLSGNRVEAGYINPSEVFSGSFGVQKNYSNDHIKKVKKSAARSITDRERITKISTFSCKSDNDSGTMVSINRGPSTAETELPRMQVRADLGPFSMENNACREDNCQPHILRLSGNFTDSTSVKFMLGREGVCDERETGLYNPKDEEIFDFRVGKNGFEGDLGSKGKTQMDIRMNVAARTNQGIVGTVNIDTEMLGFDIGVDTNREDQLFFDAPTMDLDHSFDFTVGGDLEAFINVNMEASTEFDVLKTGRLKFDAYFDVQVDADVEYTNVSIFSAKELGYKRYEIAERTSCKGTWSPGMNILFVGVQFGEWDVESCEYEKPVETIPALINNPEVIKRDGFQYSRIFEMKEGRGHVIDPLTFKYKAYIGRSGRVVEFPNTNTEITANGYRYTYEVPDQWFKDNVGDLAKELNEHIEVVATLETKTGLTVIVDQSGRIKNPDYNEPEAIPCGEPIAVTGGYDGDPQVFRLDLGTTGGRVEWDFEAFTIKDALELKYENGKRLWKSPGEISGYRRSSFNYVPDRDPQFINAIVTSSENQGTKWVLNVACPGEGINSPLQKRKLDFVIGRSDYDARAPSCKLTLYLNGVEEWSTRKGRLHRFSIDKYVVPGTNFYYEYELKDCDEIPFGAIPWNTAYFNVRGTRHLLNSPMPYTGRRIYGSFELN